MAGTVNILASGISNVEHLAAFDLVAEKRLSEIQLEKLLVYLIDTVDASALPYLAIQFDVLGYKGMKLAATVDQQRAVIKNAIKLKRKAGTPWAVQQALIAIGYPDAVLVENAGTDPDHGWAEFRIELNVGDNEISEAKLNELLLMINIYKNKRSHLIDLSYTISFIDDTLTLSDDSNESPSIDDGDSLTVGGNFKYDGQFKYNGQKNYSRDTDVLEIQIINV